MKQYFNEEMAKKNIDGIFIIFFIFKKGHNTPSPN